MIGNYVNEPVERIEPCRIEAIPERVADLIADLSAESRQLETRLPKPTAAALADLVRAMNTFYSNRIEGHNTTLREIERAMAQDFDADQDKRNLQLEARAHMRVQAEIDRLHHLGALPCPTSAPFIQWLHAEFYRDMPEDLRRIEAGEASFLMEPGAFRSAAHDLANFEVAVGRHRPPSSARVTAFMEHFQRRYDLAGMGNSQKIIAMAAAHHRLNFIHPFYDGNGRVSRLMSHAIALSAGIGAHGLWSISRGLARGLTVPTEYKAMMEQADLRRRNDLDGRGNLSQEGLIEFVAWFLAVARDQIRFMSSLFDFERLTEHLKLFVTSEGLNPHSMGILEEVVIRGEMPRGDAPRATGLPERTARMVLSALIDTGVLASATPKGPVSLRFPVHVAEVVFPKLYGEAMG